MTDTDISPDQKSSKRGIRSWMMFDWAAQPFFTVVTTFIFGPYVTSRMVSDPVAGQAAWGWGIAIAGLFIAFLSPVLGSIADNTGPRKPWILFFAVFKIIALSLLWFAEPGSNIIWVLALMIVATIAAEFSIVFNDSMMPSLVSHKDTGRVSNIAWGLGYLGGMIVLVLVLLLLAANADTGLTLLGNAPLFGLDPASGEGDRAAGPLAAIWYLIFILPMFLFTPDKVQNSWKLKQAIVKGVTELRGTIAKARSRPSIFRFLIARMIYQDGVGALLALGGVFAAGLFAWETIELGIFGILLNVVAIPSCLIAAGLDTRFGSKRVVVVSVAMLIIATIGIVSTGPGYSLFGLISFDDAGASGLFATGAEKAYIGFGLLIGAAFGPVQASSRAYLARSVQSHEAGCFFGLYAFAGRATSFFAPATVGAITWISGSTTLGMASIIIFFIVGLIVLLPTPYPAVDRETA